MSHTINIVFTFFHTWLDFTLVLNFVSQSESSLKSQIKANHVTAEKY
jgi:hypothetical protein